MTTSAFLQTYTGRSHGVLRWAQLDALWQAVRSQADAGWYASEIGAPLPQKPLDAVALAAFIDEADTFLRAEHDEKYCGVVYADDLEVPTLLKIYHPRKMGTGCGASGSQVLPRWTLSTSAPVDLLDWVAKNEDKPVWWKKMLQIR